MNNRKINRTLRSDIIVRAEIPKELENRDKLFIVGPPRSGTTLLNILLGQDHFLPECSFVSNVFKLFDEIYKYSDDERFYHYAQNLSNLIEIFKKTIYDFLYTSYIVNNIKTKDLLVYKDPILTNYIQYFDWFFAGTYKILFCIRDPRDTVASMYKVFLKQYENSNEDVLFSRALNFIFPFYQKIYNLDHETETINKNKIFLVRYESIVMQDSIQITSLEIFINHKIDFSTNNASVESKLDKASPFYSENFGKSVTKEPIGAHRNILSTAQIEEIENKFSYYLQRFNY
jgi:hypothetical protein